MICDMCNGLGYHDNPKANRVSHVIAWERGYLEPIKCKKCGGSGFLLGNAQEVIDRLDVCHQIQNAVIIERNKTTHTYSDEMKVYISLPITGHPIDEVRKKADLAKQQLSDMGHEPVSPLDVSPDPDAPYAEHIGRDIAALLTCDAALFLDGWNKSNGCLLEYFAAIIYGKKVIHARKLQLNGKNIKIFQKLG